MSKDDSAMVRIEIEIRKDLLDEIDSWARAALLSRDRTIDSLLEESLQPRRQKP